MAFGRRVRRCGTHIEQRIAAVAKGSTCYADTNANLNAAAPELYDALQKALHAIDNLTDKNDAMTSGLAALAKARGEIVAPPPTE